MPRLARSIAFARHIPPDQLMRRVYLHAKRQLLDTLWPARTAPKLGLGPPHALPTLDIRSSHGTLERTEQGWRASFLGVERPMSGCVDWNMRAEDHRAQLWRMNLHYFEYLHTLPDGDACTLIADWIARCRPRSKVSSSAGWTAYAVSLRLSAWLAWWSRRLPSDQTFEQLFSASIREQADYLCANLETDLRGNHLIKNIRALTECGAAYPGAEGARWRKLANNWLRRELPTQILPDGVHFERSPSYHAQVLGDLLVIAAVRSRDDTSPMLDGALDRMAQALVDLTHPDGFPAQFNDAGLTMAVSAAACLAAYSQVRGRAAPSPRPVFAMPDAGFFGARSDRDYVIAKMGPLGPNSLMAHAHGDWGSFEWSIGSQRVIVDQGVFEYVDGERRRVSRSTLSHNTATIDGAEQADFFGAFRCATRPCPSLAEFTPCEGGFDLFGRIRPSGLRGSGGHVRTLSFRPSVLTIEDRGEGRVAAAAVLSRLLLHPDMTVTRPSEHLAKVQGPGSLVLQVGLETGRRLAAEPAEWWPDMGDVRCSERLVANGSHCAKLRVIAFSGD